MLQHLVVHVFVLLFSPSNLLSSSFIPWYSFHFYSSSYSSCCSPFVASFSYWPAYPSSSLAFFSNNISISWSRHNWGDSSRVIVYNAFSKRIFEPLIPIIFKWSGITCCSQYSCVYLSLHVCHAFHERTIKKKNNGPKNHLFLFTCLWCPLLSYLSWILVSFQSLTPCRSSFLWSSLFPLSDSLLASTACTFFIFLHSLCMYRVCLLWMLLMKKGTLWVVNVQRRCVTQNVHPVCVYLFSSSSLFSDDRLSWIKSWTCAPLFLSLCLYPSLSVCLSS